MDDIKQKLEDAKRKADTEETAAIEARKRYKAARAELKRLEPLAIRQALRQRAEEIKRISEDDVPGRVAHLAVLVNQALQEEEVSPCRFSFPIGRGINKNDPEYYDSGAEPLSSEEARLALYVKAEWGWDGDHCDYMAKIHSDGSVALVHKVDHRVLEKITVNVLTDAPEKWVAALCRGGAEPKPAASDEDSDESEL